MIIGESMNKKNWHGILRIIEINHTNPNGDVLWSAKNILNLLHQEGEEFILRAAFSGGRVSTVIPDDYYLGLDNRQAVAALDTMDDLVGEPTGRGYERQSISSSGDFSINFEQGHYVATSPIVAFRCNSGSWGPVSNLFITDKSDNSGFLIATAAMPTGVFVNEGESVTMRIGMQLKACT